MKILFIDEELPYPLQTGKKIRTYNLIKQLAGSFDVRYLAFGDGAVRQDQAIRHLTDVGVSCYLVNVRLQRKSGLLFYWRLFANLFSEYPYIVSSHYKKEFLETMRRIIDDNRPDIVVAEWTPYGRYFEGFDSARKVVVAHNIEADIWWRYHEHETNPLKKLYIKRQAVKTERFERALFASVDGIIAVSEEDKAKIEKTCGQRPVGLVENGVDTGYFSPSSDPVEPGAIVFTGSMDWRPNQDAVRYFVTEIFPRLKKEVKEAHFYVVGRAPSLSLRSLATDEIVVTGTVPDVRPYLRKAALVVAPLRIRGGSRIKILEAMAMRKPVISTTVGAEGLRVTPGENILIGDSSDEFARNCLRALTDMPYSSRLADNGYDLVNRHYRWETIAEKMAQFLRTI